MAGARLYPAITSVSEVTSFRVASGSLGAGPVQGRLLTSSLDDADAHRCRGSAKQNKGQTKPKDDFSSQGAIRKKLAMDFPGRNPPKTVEVPFRRHSPGLRDKQPH